MARFHLLVLFLVVVPLAARSDEGAASPDRLEIVHVDDIEWSPLNPARGDASPQAGALWGDRTNEGPAGFLVAFRKSFASPPHLHNVGYRGVVIEGLVHNDDPGAAEMWMPAGAYWTQPAGEVHITSASGERNVAYIEIETGPYLVQPPPEAFDDGQRPVNVDPSNLVWLPATPTGTEVSYLWGAPAEGTWSGAFVRMAPGASAVLRGGATLRAVVVAGALQLPGTDSRALLPGSGFSTTSSSGVQTSCGTGAPCVLYVRTNGRLDVASRPETN